MSHRSVLVALLACALAFVAGCKSPFAEPEAPWPSRELAAPSENIAWTVCSMALTKSGFPVGTGADPSTLTIVSGWKTQLAPFRGDGFRERAHLALEPTTPGHWRVEVRVERESNMDIKRPMDPSYAKWEPAPDNADAAELILERVRAFLSSEMPASKG